jgi:hypothetical protein
MKKSIPPDDAEYNEPHGHRCNSPRCVMMI